MSVWLGKSSSSPGDILRRLRGDSAQKQSILWRGTWGRMPRPGKGVWAELSGCVEEGKARRCGEISFKE